MAYTNIDDPSAYFQAFTYSGTSNTAASYTFTGNSNMKPDLVWLKQRGYTDNHYLFDSTRGAEQAIYSNLTNAEANHNSSLTSFNTNGFSVGTSNVGSGGGTYVTWNFKANGGTTTSVSASGTGSGCVNACTYQANTTAGFSIITYTGRDDQLNNGQHSLLKHGLGVAPTFIILKRRDATGDWYVMGKHVTSASAYSNNEYLSLNDSDAINGNSYTGSVAPTSTDIYLGNELVNVASATYVMYAFAEKQGYSKFGSYVGNGSTDGAFVYTGFKPAFVMLKRSNTTSNWIIMDNKRNTFNEMESRLFPNLANAEQTQSTYGLDFLSNGFKLKDTVSQSNASGSTYIYMAFAENPFVTSTGIPTTAR